MASIAITFPDAATPRILNAFAARYGYQTVLPNGSGNPQTKAQFAKEVVRMFIRDVVRVHESTVAAEAAATTAGTAVDNEISFT